MANDCTAEFEAKRAAAREKYAADMEGQPPLKRGEELWWVGRDEESYGACAPARDEAIQIGRRDYDEGDRLYIIQARQDEIDLAAIFNMERFDEAVECHFEDIQGEYHNGFLSDFSSGQLLALETAMRQSIRQWQVRTRLLGGGTCFPQIFTECGKAEYIPSDKEGSAA